MNKSKKIKLQFIESGRLSSPEMNSIFGGSWSCGTYHNCHISGKNSCSGTYTNCPTATDKNTHCTGTEAYAFLRVDTFDVKQRINVSQNLNVL
jgi:natural product precursor